jgi:hypothetical protein
MEMDCGAKGDRTRDLHVANSFQGFQAEASCSSKPLISKMVQNENGGFNRKDFL